MTHRSWSRLSPLAKGAIIGLGCVQAVLLVAAQASLARRSPAEVSGSKNMWRMVSCVNFGGPIAYFVYGRRPAAD